MGILFGSKCGLREKVEEGSGRRTREFICVAFSFPALSAKVGAVLPALLLEPSRTFVYAQTWHSRPRRVLRPRVFSLAWDGEQSVLTTLHRP